MVKGFVLLGDRTTHDGEVITASSTMAIDGIRVAMVGDKVRCPIPGHGINAITEGCADWLENDVALVVDGCLSECGCRVVSSASDGVEG